MTKEEIALQLTLAQIGNLQNKKNFNSPIKPEEYNNNIAIQTTSLYNTIYSNLTCLDGISLEEQISNIKTY